MSTMPQPSSSTSQNQRRPGALFYPKILSLKNYSLRLFLTDFRAGIIVGIAAFPLAIAFAIASGMDPSRGLIASIVGGFLISLLGGSRVQIGGTTGAFAIIVGQILAHQGMEALLLCTLLAGLMLIIMGLLKWGAIIRYIPYPLTVGFTAGVGVLIASSQIKDLLGLNMEKLPGDFLEKWRAYFHALPSIDFTTSLLSLCCLLLLVLWPKISRKIPAPLVAIVSSTIVVNFFSISTPTLNTSLSFLNLGPEHFDWNPTNLKNLLSPAFTIAFLGALQSLLSASVADGFIEGRHRPNTELIAQGVSNMIVPFFGGMPVSGALARTLTNVKNGGKTPIAGMIHSIFLLGVVFLFREWIAHIPLATLAAVLLMISYNMIDWKSCESVLKSPKEDTLVMLSTFFLTVFVDITVGVSAGIFIAFALFVKRMSTVSSFKKLTSTSEQEENDEEILHQQSDSITLRKIPENVSVYEIEGALFFGVTELFRDHLDIGRDPPKVLILRTRHILVLDATGLRAIRDLYQQCIHSKTQLILSGVQAQPREALEHSGLLHEIGEKNVVSHIDLALRRAQELLKNKTVH